MQLLDEDEDTANAAQIGAEAEKAADPADGRDADWNRRMKEKLDRMKAKKMRDISITVTQKAGLTGTLATYVFLVLSGWFFEWLKSSSALTFLYCNLLHFAISSRQRKRSGDEKVTGQGRVREELTQRQGTIEFLTGDEDGSVDICVQSIIANRNSPSRIALNVTMSVSEDAEKEDSPKKGEGEPGTLGHDEAKNQMSRLERDLQTLSNRVRAILNNADFNKDQEVAFHDQSVAMNRAAQYWPIIQLVVILVAGFTQANHIVQYMRTHHIGI